MKQRPSKSSSIAIVGLGNWGTSLAHALLGAGSVVDEIVLTSRKGQKPPSSELAGLCRTMSRARLTANVLWLCVPDAAISRVTHQLVRRVSAPNGMTGRTVVHSSGALSSVVLKEAAEAGAAVASAHPLMTFPTRTPVALQGVPFGVEADDSTRQVLNRIVRRVGGRPFPVEASAKALYHAVGMLVSPLLVSHLVAAQQAAALAGFTPREVRQLIEPIAQATLENVFSRGAAKSFSGPIARGDVQTIRLHLQALKPHPMLAEIYRSLALYALEALPASRSRSMRLALG